jgi:hypothetical protein
MTPTYEELLAQLQDLPNDLNWDKRCAQDAMRTYYLGRHGKLAQILAYSGGLTPAELEQLQAEAAKVKAQLEAQLP